MRTTVKNRLNKENGNPQYGDDFPKTGDGEEMNGEEIQGTTMESPNATKVKSSNTSSRSVGKKKKNRVAESEGAWRDAWYHFFRVLARLTKKEFTQEKKDFNSMGESWNAFSLQIPIVGKLLIIMVPIFAVGEFLEKFSVIIGPLSFRKKKGEREENGVSDSSYPT